MLTYATVGTNNLDLSIPFYTALLATQGASKLFDHPRGGAFFAKDGKMVLGVLKPFDGQPATVGNGTMIALEMPTRKEVDAFYSKAIELGGTSEGDPGERAPSFYMAYFRDPEGNKFAACCLG